MWSWCDADKDIVCLRGVCATAKGESVFVCCRRAQKRGQLHGRCGAAQHVAGRPRLITPPPRFELPVQDTLRKLFCVNLEMGLEDVCSHLVN